MLLQLNEWEWAKKTPDSNLINYETAKTEFTVEILKIFIRIFQATFFFSYYSNKYALSCTVTVATKNA